ncbi:MAG: ATP synthase subunit I [Deltaproteobacteria bacterium]|nr:ATP synthase subunit I [Deltaproteobacteria bacterium]
MHTISMDWNIIYANLTKRNWIILLFLSLAGFFFLGDRFTLGIMAGGLVSIANFGLLQNTITKTFPTQETEGRKTALLVKFYFRLLGLGIAIYLLLKSGRTDPIGLVIGLSTVVIGIISFGITNALKTTTGEAS